MGNILLRRFIVSAKGQTVYDEQFRQGLNIIRGQNGSGKSTIIELIYYALGSDQISWKEESLKCDYVLAEFEISTQPITIKRDILKEGKPPLAIHWGKINDATTTSWEVYSMKRSVEKESFSQAMLRLLNIPDSIQSEDVSLTMHQLLRILYIDQLSPVNLLMRPERFDKQMIREAVSKTLMGAYDINLLNDEFSLKNKRKDVENYKNEIDRLKYILKENSSNLTAEELRKKIIENNNQIQNIDKSLLEKMQIAIKEEEKVSNKEIKDIFLLMNKAKTDFSDLKIKINTINYDINDSEEFINDLYQRRIDIDNSINMRKIIPSLSIQYCPLCLNHVDHVQHDIFCPLCKQKPEGNNLTSEALRLKNELFYQIKESEILLTRKRTDLELANSKLAIIKKQVDSYQSKIDSFNISIETTQQQERDKLLFLKGELSKEIEYLNKDLIFQEKIKEEERIIDRLQEEISELERRIETKKARLAKNYSTAMSKIKEIAIEFIKNDLPRDLPSDDYSLSKLNIDFEIYNTFSIDERYNFAASSMAYLKNSIHFAFFFASLSLTSMNYPRFIMCDNIEDKGLEADRSHKFQLNLFAKSLEYKDELHQIIIATSMIEPSLNNTEICIGEYYTNESKSLKIASSEKID